MKVYDRLDRQHQKYRSEYSEAALRVLDSAHYILGPEVNNFELEYAKTIGIKHCIGLNSGLDALIFALKTLGIKDGDEVIVPANTFIATVIAITENGATPIFVEPDQYYNLDASKIESAVNIRTKAVIVVHLYGQPANMVEIKKITDKHKLFLIEDCAQAHTATFEDMQIGLWGDVGCFSFYPTKNLGAFGDGGAIVTNNDDIAAKIKIIRNYGSSIKYQNDMLGLNSRLDEIQAALLSVKLRHLSELVAERVSLAEKYLRGIKNPLLKLPLIRKGASHVFHLFVVEIDNRDHFQNYLLNHEIKTQIHYPIPPHLQKCYRYLNYKTGAFPITEHFANHILSLPLYNGMTNDEINYVIDTINDYRL